MSQLQSYIWKEGVCEKWPGDFRIEWRENVSHAEKDTHEDEIFEITFCGLSLFQVEIRW